MCALLIALVCTACALIEHVAATSCESSPLSCRQNEGRHCTKAELLAPYLSSHISSGYHVTIDRKSATDSIGKQTDIKSGEMFTAHNPSLFAHGGQLWTFLRLDLGLSGQNNTCPPRRLSNLTRCPDDGTSVQLRNARAYAKLNGELQLDIHSNKDVVVMHEDFIAAAPQKSGASRPQDGRAFTWGDEVWVIYTDVVVENCHQMFVQRAFPSETVPVHLDRPLQSRG